MIPPKLHLDFSSAPPTITIQDPVPEPVGHLAQNGFYLDVRGKISYYRKELEALPLVGDKDLDHRQEKLIEEADSHLQLLEQLRDDAWVEHLVSRYLAETSSSSQGVHIVHKRAYKNPSM